MKIALALLVVWTAWLYAPLRSAGYVYEDENFLASSAPIVWAVPGRAFSLWSLRLTADDPGRAHLVNVGLHLVTGLVIAAVVAALIPGSAAVWAAGVWWLHPIQSAAVSYVSARTDLLMTLGVLLACASIVRSGRWRWVGVSAGLAIALTSKEIGVVAIPLVGLTWVVWRSAARRAQLVAASLGFLGVVVTYATWAPWLAMAPRVGGSTLDWGAFVAVQVTAAIGMLRLVVWPVGFTIDHDWLAAAAVWQGVACGVAGLLLLLMAVGLWRRWPIGWALAWVAVSLAPRVLIPTQEYVQDHQFYLPFAGIAFGIGSLTQKGAA